MSAPATVAERHHHAHGPANRRRRVLETAAPLFVRFPGRLAETAVVVLHDAYGLTAPIEDCCRELARHGHLAVAPILYHENGGRAFTTDQPDLAESAWRRLRHADLVADVAATLDYLERRCGVPSASTALLGFGESARLAAEIASEHQLGAVVGAENVRGLAQDVTAVRHPAAEIHRALLSTFHRREQQ